MNNLNLTTKNEVELGKVVIKRKRFTLKSFNEKAIELIFASSGYLILITILSVFLFLLWEGWNALDSTGLKEFLFFEDKVTGVTSSQWNPTSTEEKYSLLPLIAGSFLTSLLATLIASLAGILTGIYLSEIAGTKTREILKPAIEMFSAIPTVALGFIMLVLVATFITDIFNPENRLNALLASVGLSIIVIPIVATLTEDALRSIPEEIRLTSLSLGASRWQTVFYTLIPAASGGISAGILLGFSRAIGETMIVLMTTGNASNLTFNIFSSVRTMTATIGAELGEVAFGTPHYYALFLIGLILFVLTFLINFTADIINRIYRGRNKF